MSDLCWKVSLKSSSDSYYDLLKVVNKKVEYLRMISKSNAREWWDSAPLDLQDAPSLGYIDTSKLKAVSRLAKKLAHSF